MNHPLFKLSLYLIGILVIEFVSRAEKLSSEDVAAWLAWDWVKFSASILGAVVLAARMFFDQSFARHQAQNGHTDQPIGPTPPAPGATA